MGVTPIAHIVATLLLASKSMAGVVVVAVVVGEETEGWVGIEEEVRNGGGGSNMKGDRVCTCIVYCIRTTPLIQF